MKIALAQFNPIVGDIAGNTGRIADSSAAHARPAPISSSFPSCP